MRLSGDLIGQFGEQHVAGFFLVLARVSPLFVLAPLFSSNLIPPRVRGIVAVALTVGIAPIALHAGRIPLDALAYAGLMLKELLVGLGFAFSLGALFAALSAAGTFADSVVGFSFAFLVGRGRLQQLLAFGAILVGRVVVDAHARTAKRCSACRTSTAGSPSWGRSARTVRISSWV
jgi:flagellar biosynthetic protein FliR